MPPRKKWYDVLLAKGCRSEGRNGPGEGHCRTRPRSPWSSGFPNPLRKLGADGYNQLLKPIQGAKFTDGIELNGNSAATEAQAAA